MKRFGYLSTSLMFLLFCFLTFKTLLQKHYTMIFQMITLIPPNGIKESL